MFGYLRIRDVRENSISNDLSLGSSASLAPVTWNAIAKGKLCSRSREYLRFLVGRRGEGPEVGMREEAARPGSQHYP